MTHISFIRIAFAFILGLASLQAVDPPSRFSFSSYGSSQGLGNLAIRCLQQDRVGFLWVGTEDGLFRFDGLRFQSYSQTEGLPSSYINALGLDGQGRLWAATYAGLALQEGDRFKPIPTEGMRINGMATENQACMWIGSDRGLFSLGGDFTLHPVWTEGSVTALSLGRDGSLWIASGNHLLRRGVDGAWKPMGTSDGEDIRHLVAGPGQQIWAVGSRSVWRWHPLAGLERIRGDEHLGRPNGSPTWDFLGRLWVPRTGGASCFENGTWKNISRANGLPVASVEAILTDREGNLWMGATGLHRMLGQGALEAITSLEGLPEDTIRGVWQDGQELMVGTDEGLALWDAPRWRIVPGTAQHSIRTFCTDSEGHRYLAGLPTEILEWPQGGSQAQDIPRAMALPKGILGTGRIFRLHWNRNELWVGTENAGLVSLHREGKAWKGRRIELPGGTAQERCSDLDQDTSGRIWVCGEQGLAVQMEDGSWKRFTRQDGLLRTHVAYLCQRRNGEFLVAYFDPVGLTRFRFQDGSLQVLGHLDRTRGLRSDKVYTVAEDRKGRLWVGTSLGLNLFPDSTHLETHEDFTCERGLASEDCNAQAFLEDPEGDIWIGTSGGLARLRSQRLRGLPVPPPTRILAASFGEHRLGLRTGERLATQLPDNALNVHFAGLGFATSGNLEYQIRLLGLEDKWQPTSAREVRFPGLRPGTFRFEVRTRYPGGEWGSVEGLDFVVEPRIWQHVWFWITVCGSLLAIIALIVKWRIDQLHIQSISDPLTGLRNRRSLKEGFQREVDQLLRRCNRANGSRAEDNAVSQDLIFFMVDIDHFKQVNDVHGHAAGDRVLQQMSKILLQASRGSDSVIRWGGEEFLLIARHANRKQAHILAERIRASVASHPFDTGETTLHLSCSVGFCPFPFQLSDPENVSWESTVDLADQCMYAAKHSGRNLWVGIQSLSSSPLPRRGEERTYAIPAWLEDGLVELETNHPEPQRMIWEMVGTL